MLTRHWIGSTAEYRPVDRKNIHHLQPVFLLPIQRHPFLPLKQSDQTPDLYTPRRQTASRHLASQVYDSDSINTLQNLPLAICLNSCRPLLKHKHQQLKQVDSFIKVRTTTDSDITRSVPSCFRTEYQSSTLSHHD